MATWGCRLLLLIVLGATSALNRLVSSVLTSETAASLFSDTWTLDKLSNWTSLTRTAGSSGVTTTFTPDTRNQYTVVQAGGITLTPVPLPFGSEKGSGLP